MIMLLQLAMDKLQCCNTSRMEVLTYCLYIIFLTLLIKDDSTDFFSISSTGTPNNSPFVVNNLSPHTSLSQISWIRPTIKLEHIWFHLWKMIIIFVEFSSLWWHTCNYNPQCQLSLSCLLDIQRRRITF